VIVGVSVSWYAWALGEVVSLLSSIDGSMLGSVDNCSIVQ
jgi:hypothetical protein